jgi:hypothetical protein
MPRYSADFQKLLRTDQEVVDEFLIALSYAPQCQELRACVELNLTCCFFLKQNMITFYLFVSIATALSENCECDPNTIAFPELDALTLPVSPAAFDWCGFKRAASLSHDLNEWLWLPQLGMSACPPGEALLSAYELLARINSGWITTTPQLLESTEFHALDATLRRTSPNEVYESGWSEIFPVLGLLYNANSRQEPSACEASSDVATIVSQLMTGSPPQMASFDGISLNAAECGVERLAKDVIFAVKDGNVASEYLQTGFPALIDLIQTQLPIFDVLSVLRFPVKVDLNLKGSIDWMPDYTPIPEIENSSFRMNLLPIREMLSEYVRYTKQPFCSTHHFRTFINKLIKTNVKSVNIVEGGPNMGDCVLWAAALMRAAGKTTNLVFVEPLPQAAKAIQDSIKDNDFQGSVYATGFGNTSQGTFKLVFIPGRDGQASDLGIYADCPNGVGCTILDIPEVTLADIWNSSKTLEILKLSTNGAELKTLEGARPLLAAGRVCSVFVHLKNLWKGLFYGGKKDSTYIARLWSVLHENDMNILFYENYDMRFPRPVVVSSAAQLNAAIDRPDVINHFFTAHTTRKGFCDEFLSYANFY